MKIRSLLVPVFPVFLVGFGVAGASISALAAGCAATTASTVGAAVAAGAPIVEGALCTLAADQGVAEPGWEAWICQLVDPNGKPIGTAPAFRVFQRKGSPPLASRALR